ncbi:hypothetical protein EYF80_015236 [Liparis tanakae]|uniref:Uncharacterized protein n=1 Tax=Liparis tanakae TaxID=230148 RepID=A0A4Z2I8V4_9TELE|nr:hypothetical protein EYF80_015236 [Liparis tanakae]
MKHKVHLPRALRPPDVQVGRPASSRCYGNPSIATWGSSARAGSGLLLPVYANNSAGTAESLSSGSSSIHFSQRSLKAPHARQSPCADKNSIHLRSSSRDKLRRGQRLLLAM